MKRETKSRHINLSIPEEVEVQNKNKIEKLYSEVLEENLTPPEIKDRLILSTTIEEKEKYVSIHRNTAKSTTWGAGDTTLMNNLKRSKYPDIDILLDLKIRLSTASRQYIEHFLKLEGIAILIDIITSRLNRKAMDEFDAATIYEILLSCKLIMNYSIGMKSFLDVIGSMDCLARCLNFEFKPLAMLVLEMLSVSCFSENSTLAVVNAIKKMAAIRGEPPFSYFTSAIADEDVEVKAAVMEFINCLVVGADLDTRASLRSIFTTQKIDFHCDEALQQLDAELGAVEPVQGARTPLRKGISVKKVVNVDKLGNAPLIALKGVRATSMRGTDFQVNRFASETNKKKNLSMIDLDAANMPRGGALIVPFAEYSIFGAKKVNSVRLWHTLSEDGFRRHAGESEKSSVVMTIPIGQIHDILETTMEKNMLRLVGRDHIHVLEVVGESQTMTMGFQSKQDRDDWVKSIGIFRDKRLIAKSSYSMQRTYLELRDALHCAERFRKLYADYTSIAAEEKQFSIDTCGIDVNDINTVYQYLRNELTAQGLEHKLLAIFQEFLLLPAQNEGAWNAVAKGVHNVIQLTREGNERLDDGFADKSIPELLKEKAEEEGQSYAQMSKLALSTLQKDQEIADLKEQLKELSENTINHSNSADSLTRKTIQSELKERQLPEVPEGSKSKQPPSNKISDAIKEKLLVIFKKDLVVKVLPEVGLSEEELKALLGDDFTLPTATDERYGKYIKMKQMLPEGAVRQKMKLDSFTDEEIDAFLSGKTLPAAPPAAAAAVASAAPEVPAEDKFTKFDKMKKMFPEGPVRQKMKLDGISDEEIDAFFNGTLKRGGGSTVAVAAAAPAVDEKYLKFIKMKSMLPEGAVRQKMQMEGLSAQEIDDVISGKISAAPVVDTAAAETPPSRYEKFEKMRKLLPEPAVRQKMGLEGFTPEEIDGFFAGKIIDSKPATAAPAGGGGPPAVFDPAAALKAGIAGGLKKPAAAAEKPKEPVAPPRIPKYTTKCKNIFWSKIPDTDVKNTIWKDLQPFELNPDIKREIEERFAAKVAIRELGSAVAVAMAVNKLHHGHQQKPKLVSLIDGKRTQNILIILGKLRKTSVEIVQMIRDVNPRILTLEVTQSLLTILPNAEEINAVKDYPNPENLDKASEFVYQLTKIPNLQPRLQTHEIIFNWFHHASSIVTQLTAFQNACDELHKSQNTMEIILSIILSIGNYVNDCTKFGDAQGIKIDTLLKLKDMKTNNEQQHGNNLLNYLAVLLAKQSPDLLKFSESFVAIWAAAELSFSQIVNDMATVEKQILKLTEDSKKLKNVGGTDTAAENSSSPSSPSEEGKNGSVDPLAYRIDSFLKDANPKMLTLKNHFKAVEATLEQIMNQFGESNKTMSEEDNAKHFFVVITTFIRQLLQAHDENVKKEQARIRKMKIEKERAEREQKRLAKAKNSNDEDQSSVVTRAQMILINRMRKLQNRMINHRRVVPQPIPPLLLRSIMKMNYQKKISSRISLIVDLNLLRKLAMNSE